MVFIIMFTVRNLLIILVDKANEYKLFSIFTVKKNNRVS